LQVQLASPGKGKASRETVSRVLLMLRITGWLSLCKRVRDDKGRVRGNIYAPHDEPLTFRDAESLDPRFLDVVAGDCLSNRRTVSQIARDVLDEIKNDPTMRYYHSHLSLLETRLGRPQTAGQLAARQHSSLLTPKPGSGSELSVNRIKNNHQELSTETELSQNSMRIIQSSDS
ncbi:helix-turn-helix domain-containing protein, partial [Salmonella enterica subsp. enterica serovar Derby]|nr:helix-turn-helix domain-containing protein [Salmonella enterica subsp. enterica serovar Derby]